MEEIIVSLDGWGAIQAEGTSSLKKESTGSLDWLIVEGSTKHDAAFWKIVKIPESSKVHISAYAVKFSNSKSLDIQIGANKQADVFPEYGNWLGRNAVDGILTHELDGPVSSVRIFLRSKSDYSGYHIARFRDIIVCYEPLSDTEPPAPPPDDGIAGQLARVCAKINGALEEIKIHLQEIDTLFAEKQKAQDWVDTYNRSIKDE